MPPVLSAAAGRVTHVAGTREGSESCWNVPTPVTQGKGWSRTGPRVGTLLGPSVPVAHSVGGGGMRGTQ